MSQHFKVPIISICIPTTRADTLERCLESIHAQTFKDYEIITDNTKGSLAVIRNSLARRATGKIIVFIDDDTSVARNWLGSILQGFEQCRTVAGVSGPSVINRKFKANRDIFNFRFFKWLYDKLFCPGWAHLPGHITKSGAWTTGACDEDCNYEGEVMFLEACNMAFRRNIFWELGGFDESYGGVGEWSEPDLCFRIRKKGYKLWFTQEARLYHEPSRSGAYKKRIIESKLRLANYYQFLDRWVQPHWRRTLFKHFLKLYYEYKAVT